MEKNLLDSIKLVSVTFQEMMNLKSGNKILKCFEHQLDIANLIPEVVIQTAIKRHMEGEDWFWCAPRIFYSTLLKVMVGSGTFINTLNENKIEIGYGIISPYEGRGFATAGVACMVKEAFTCKNIEVILAQTLVENIASARVLEKNFFIRRGQWQDEEDGLLILWKYEVR